MIIECEECRSKFELDEGLLKEGGSKVRCSVCKHIFTVFPPEPESDHDPALDSIADVNLEETVTLDSPPGMEEIGAGATDEDVEEAFDKAFEEALEDGFQEEAMEEGSGGSDIDEEIEEPEGEEGDISFERNDEEAGPDERAGVMKKGRSGSKVLLIALIIILLLIMGALAVVFFMPDLLPDSLSFLKPGKKEAITDTGIRRLTFEDVSGSFIQSNKLGQLFVIKGRLVNQNPDSRSHILVKGTIYNSKGEAIRRRLVYAGNTFDESLLKEMSLEEIEKGLRIQPEGGNSNFNVRPSDSVPFMIVFENLPDNLSEFEVEVVSSAPGK
jgi:predicted Zn finger-like uncharacterized protein